MEAAILIYRLASAHQLDRYPVVLIISATQECRHQTRSVSGIGIATRQSPARSLSIASNSSCRMVFGVLSMPGAASGVLWFLPHALHGLASIDGAIHFAPSD